MGTVNPVSNYNVYTVDRTHEVVLYETQSGPEQASFILLKKKHLVTTADIKMALENTFD